MSRQTKMEKMLLHAGRMLTSTLDYEELMKLVLELTIKASDAAAALVYRLDKDEPVVRGRFLRAGEEEVKYYKLKRGEGIIGWVAENREPQVVHDVMKDPRFSPRLEEFLNIKFRSVLAVPLIGRDVLMLGVGMTDPRLKDGWLPPNRLGKLHAALAFLTLSGATAQAAALLDPGWMLTLLFVLLFVTVWWSAALYFRAWQRARSEAQTGGAGA